MKTCFKCGLSKEITEFYKHPQMEDGHLNKCKGCAKNDVKEREIRLRDNPEWIESERKRGRKKYHRLYKGMGRSKPDNNKRWVDKFPEKRIAHLRSQHLKKQFENVEKHHWSYNEEHYKDVIWLTKKHHMKTHRFLVYDQERLMYRRCDTFELLDTKERHEEFIKFCIETKED